MAYMILTIALPDGAFAELEGPNITEWNNNGDITYKGSIDEAPKSLLDTLLALGAIHKK